MLLEPATTAWFPFGSMPLGGDTSMCPEEAVVLCQGRELPPGTHEGSKPAQTPQHRAPAPILPPLQPGSAATLLRSPFRRGCAG